MRRPRDASWNPLRIVYAILCDGVTLIISHSPLVDALEPCAVTAFHSPPVKIIGFMYANYFHELLFANAPPQGSAALIGANPRAHMVSRKGVDCHFFTVRVLPSRTSSIQNWKSAAIRGKMTTIISTGQMSLIKLVAFAGESSLSSDCSRPVVFSNRSGTSAAMTMATTPIVSVGNHQLRCRTRKNVRERASRTFCMLPPLTPTPRAPWRIRKGFCARQIVALLDAALVLFAYALFKPDRYARSHNSTDDKQRHRTGDGNFIIAKASTHCDPSGCAD